MMTMVTNAQLMTAAKIGDVRDGICRVEASGEEISKPDIWCASGAGLAKYRQPVRLRLDNWQKCARITNPLASRTL
jgi:hypothetical protein